MSTLIHERLGRLRHRGADEHSTSTIKSATGEHPHPGRVFLCLLWKEYRQLRALWIVLAAIIFIATSLMALRLVISHGRISMTIVVVLPGLFVLAASSMFYANEQEQGTDRWLIQWTVPSVQLFLTKCLVMTVGALSLGSFSILLIYLFDLPREIPSDGIGEYVMILIISFFMCFVCSSFVSVLAGRVILSAAIGGVASFLLICVAGFILDWEVHHAINGYDWRKIMAVYMTTASVLAVALFALTAVIFDRRLAGHWITCGEGRSISSIESNANAVWCARQPRSPAVALLWKEFRQSLGWIVGILVFMFGIVVLDSPGISIIYSHVMHHGVVSRLGSIDDPTLEFIRFVFHLPTWLPCFIGLLSFSGDQQGRRFRFLAYQGVSPALVWAEKQVVWLSLALICVPVILLTVFTGEITKCLLWSPLAVLTVFATLQLSSLVIHQPIIAFAAGSLLSLLFLYCSFAMTVLDVPVFMLAIPLPLVLLASSCLITRSWLEERTGWRHAAWKVGVIAGPLAFLFIVVCLFRAFEIPSTKLQELVPTKLPPATPGQVESANAYAELVQRAEPDNLEVLNNIGQYSQHAGRIVNLGEVGTLHGTQALVSELAATTKRLEGMLTRLEPGVHHEWAAYWRERMEFRFLSAILLQAAKEHEKEGEWDKANEDYLTLFRLIYHASHRAHLELRREIDSSLRRAWEGIVRWAKQPGTTVPQIIAMINQLKQEAVASPEMIKEWYLADLDRWSDQRFKPNGRGMFDATYFYAPWERERARRLSDFAHKGALDEIQALIAAPPRTLDQALEYRFPTIDYKSSLDKWLGNTPISILTVVDSGPEGRELISRMHLAALAAIAWKKDHGEWPSSLSAACRKYIGSVLAVPEWSRPYQIVTNGSRFKIINETDETLKRMRSDPEVVSKLFGGESDKGFSTDPNEK